MFMNGACRWALTPCFRPISSKVLHQCLEFRLHRVTPARPMSPRTTQPWQYIPLLSKPFVWAIPMPHPSPNHHLGNGKPSFPYVEGGTRSTSTRTTCPARHLENPDDAEPWGPTAGCNGTRTLTQEREVTRTAVLASHSFSVEDLLARLFPAGLSDLHLLF